MKRTPVMRRKGGPAVIIAFGSPKMDKMAAEQRESEMDDDMDDAMEKEMSDEKDTLTCPKCGAELADTPENREYAKMRADEMDEDESDDEMDEDEA